MRLRTLKYPLALSPSGDLEMVEDYPGLVAQAIQHGLKTIKGELVWHPKSGREWLVFSTTRSMADVLASLRGSIQDALTGYDGVTFSLLGGMGDDGVLDVVVRYQVPDVDPRDLKLEIRLL